MKDPSNRGKGSGHPKYSGGALYMPNPRSVLPAPNSTLSPLPPERADYDRGATVDIPLANGTDMRKREMELQAREAELLRREEELKRREDAIAQAGIKLEDKNWPPFFPLIHHDIANDIPINLQKLQYVAFTTFLGLAFCLLWNFIVITIAWIKGEGVKIWLLSIIYIITCIPGAYFLWYRPLYRAMRTDGALYFGWFFFGYMLHIIFCLVAAVAPAIFFDGKSLTGILPAISLMSYSYALGVLYFIGFALFILEVLLSIWVVQQVYTYFRGSGKAAQMKKEAARQTMMAAL